MIPCMTEPVGEISRVTLAGFTFEARAFTDMQLMHMARYARILTRDEIANVDKYDAMEKMFTIIHKCVVSPDDLAKLIELEEDGKVVLRDLTAIARKPDQEEVVAPVVRRGRGRPRKSA